MIFFKKLRNKYVIWHANRVKIPKFTSNIIVRKKAVFSGRVQKVGFRLEVYCIARRMKLTGWVRNLNDGSVEAELQGEGSQTNFLVNCMRSLKRASVKNLTIIDLPIREGEESFTIVE
ncbi:acylphosphatase [Paenibacillus motobuensis]|uniref:acylphosphatase n=1 Tax=Paenibacillus TaxID=44249 RepID=UPI00203D6A30|nr:MULTISPECIES: acylphosphatase [Paenibacillus]MCM3038753.1 acylphosphatase [Paenibacillus lutimineralis]MCM3645857.1 acylphosphatase [Paenibacillus motobuensis]